MGMSIYPKGNMVVVSIGVVMVAKINQRKCDLFRTAIAQTSKQKDRNIRSTAINIPHKARRLPQENMEKGEKKRTSTSSPPNG